MSIRLELIRKILKCGNPQELKEIKQIALDAYDGKFINGEYRHIGGRGLDQVWKAADLKLELLSNGKESVFYLLKGAISEKGLLLDIVKELIKP